ncbi:S100P-binding protein-like [Cheilinus undulatus]|uniref:S100P-binding protein-like n=1 Tax=Cheilinus undulatus TaxID=241271 RepID=UPI001BD5ECA3|nr:S100P-binding protein-like [Cheilinus undulatus]
MDKDNQTSSAFSWHSPFINFKIKVENNCHKKRKYDSGSDSGYETPNKKVFCSTEKYEEVLLNPAADFDYDVDDILCLNPCGSSSAKAFSDNVESDLIQSGNSFEKEPVVNSHVTHEKNTEIVDWQVKGDENKNKILNVKDVEKDKGYSSVSYIKDLELGKNLSQSAYAQLPSETFSPKLRQKLEDDSQPRSSPEQQSCHKEFTLSGQGISFIGSDLCPIVTGPQLEPLSSPGEALEGDVEVWNIGPPRFESSLCQQVSENLDDNVEQVSEKLQGDAEPTPQCHAALGVEDPTLSSFEETILPPVKIKSAVVAAGQFTCWSKAAPWPEHDFEKQSQRDSHYRPVMGKREDIEHEKRLYVHAVTRHMNEKPHDRPAVVNELQNLMTHVADQRSSTYGGQWQHPSDLTRRNYKKRFGNAMPKVSLREWMEMNSRRTHKRFAKVPKTFERSAIA